MSNQGSFVPYSFGGNIPFYVYQSTAQDSINVNKIIIGQTTNRWKIEIDSTDGDKLKFFYSSDNGVTWTARMEISHLAT